MIGRILSHGGAKPKMVSAAEITTKLYTLQLIEVVLGRLRTGVRLSVVVASIGFGRTKSTVRSAFGCGLHPGAHPLTTLV